MPLKQTKKARKPAAVAVEQPYSQTLAIAYVSQPYSSSVPFSASGVPMAPAKSESMTMFTGNNYYVPVASTPATTSTRDIPDTNRRNWEAWSASENQLFFESLVRNSSRSWAAIAADVGTKRQEQVRTYYYRVLRKVTRLLQQVNYSVDNRDRIATLLAMMAYWESKNETKLEETSIEFAEAIKERIGRQRSALESIRAKRMTAPPEKLVVQLVPKSDEVSKIIEAGGYNPRLQLTLRATKSVAGVVNHISKKWIGTDGKCLAPFPIRLYPIEKRLGHTGWGAEDSETLLLGIFQSLGCPQAVRFEYCWPEVAIPMVLADQPSGFEHEEDTLTDLAILQQQKAQQIAEALSVPAPAPIMGLSMAMPIPTINSSVPSAPIFDPSAYATGFASPLPSLVLSASMIIPNPANTIIAAASSPSSESWDEQTSYGYEPSSVEEISNSECPPDFYGNYQQTTQSSSTQNFFDTPFF